MKPNHGGIAVSFCTWEIQYHQDCSEA